MTAPTVPRKGHFGPTLEFCCPHCLRSVRLPPATKPLCLACEVAMESDVPHAPAAAKVAR